MGETRKVEVTGYELLFTDTSGNNVELKVRESGYAEQILRGLVHSRIAVTISEIDMEIEVPVDDRDFNLKCADAAMPMVTGRGRY